jgi:hypothetical protein
VLLTYHVRTTSGATYVTQAAEPVEAMNAVAPWRRVVFTTSDTHRVVMLRGSALESVEIEQNRTAE